ncbi:hypothetical protein KDRO_B01980 [Kluyveromyces lactis]|nr:hypothetical protein KDRO_B01980 [Kluyveromyces lactis]
MTQHSSEIKLHDKEEPSTLGFPQLMGMVYHTDFQVINDVTKGDDMARWLDNQTDEVSSNLLQSVEDTESIQSDISLISEFFRSKTDLVKSLLERNSADNNDFSEPDPIILNLQQHVDGTSQDENDAKTLFDLDPMEEMNLIEQEVMNKIFTERVILEIITTLRHVHI